MIKRPTKNKHKNKLIRQQNSKHVSDFASFLFPYCQVFPMCVSLYSHDLIMIIDESTSECIYRQLKRASIFVHRDGSMNTSGEIYSD